MSNDTYDRLVNPGFCKHGQEGDRCEENHDERFDVLGDSPIGTSAVNDSYPAHSSVRPAVSGDVERRGLDALADAAVSMFEGGMSEQQVLERIEQKIADTDLNETGRYLMARAQRSKQADVKGENHGN